MKANKNVYSDFLNSEKSIPPRDISEKINLLIQTDLKPTFFSVFAKLTVAHFFVSLVSLSICPQFDLQTLPLFNFMKTFLHSLDHNLCQLACGVFFLSLTGFAGYFTLNIEEFNFLGKNKFLQVSLLSLLSIGVLTCAGANVFFVPLMFWLIGTTVGGILSIQLMSFIFVNSVTK